VVKLAAVLSVTALWGTAGTGHVASASVSPSSWHLVAHFPKYGYLGTISCSSGEMCVATSGRLAYRSTDGGRHWTHSAWAPPETKAQDALNAVACPTTTVCVAVGGNEPTHPLALVRRSVDGGATWRAGTVLGAAANNSELQAVVCPTVRRCVAVGYTPTFENYPAAGWIVETNNAGRTWQTVLARRRSDFWPRDFTSISCPSATTCFAIGGGRFGTTQAGVMARTTDGGAHWTLIRDVAGHSYPTSISCATASACAVYNPNGNENPFNAHLVRIFLVDADGRRIARQVLPPSTTSNGFHALECRAEFCGLTDGKSLWRSDDGGRTYRRVQSPPYVYAQDISCRQGDCYAIGYSQDLKTVFLMTNAPA
jgi:photosystem II stability/assembly factor-like uncharacterized protein